MANDRITQEVAEVLMIPTSAGRTTQEAAEVLMIPTSKGRGTQVVAETMVALPVPVPAPFITATTTLYAPNVILGTPIYPPFIAATGSVFAPLVTMMIAVPFIDQTTVVRAPTLFRKSIPVPFISDTHLFTPFLARPLTNVSPPAISGTPTAGQQLEASPGVWSGTEPIFYSYQWRRCNSSGAACVDIAGETGRTYIVRAADVGNTIRVRVTASN